MPLSFSTSTLKRLKTTNASNFSCKKYTHIFQLKSSINIMKHRLRPLEFGFIDLQRSEWTNSDTFFALHYLPYENGLCDCRLTIQLSQVLIGAEIWGRPITMYFFMQFFQSIKVQVTIMKVPKPCFIF